MFGFGNKKRDFIAELSKELSEMANVPLSEVERFTSEYRNFVLSESFDRGLDSFTGAWNVCDKLIERIHVAHLLEKYESARIVPDYMLLASFKFSILLSENAAANGQTAPSSFLPMVLPLKVDATKSDHTYGDVLENLISNDSSIFRKDS